MPTICGVCGECDCDIYGYCINGHDCWVEARDFKGIEIDNNVLRVKKESTGDVGLAVRISKIAQNLSISPKELWEKVHHKSMVDVPYYCKFYNSACKGTDCPACRLIKKCSITGETVDTYKHCTRYEVPVEGVIKVRHNDIGSNPSGCKRSRYS